MVMFLQKKPKQHPDINPGEPAWPNNAPDETLYDQMKRVGCVECQLLPPKFRVGKKGDLYSSIVCCCCGQGYFVVPMANYAQKVML